MPQNESFIHTHSTPTTIRIVTRMAGSTGMFRVRIASGPNGLIINIKGEDTLTTLGRLEVIAATAALESLQAPSIVHLHSTSEYLISGALAFVPHCDDVHLPGCNNIVWKKLVKAAARHYVTWHLSGLAIGTTQVAN